MTAGVRSSTISPVATLTERDPPLLSIDLDGWYLDPLGEAEHDELRDLFMGCEDYVLMSEGRRPSSVQVEELLRDLPPDRTVADKHVLGIRRKQGRLVGVVDVVRGYPVASEWYLGLLLLLPAERGRGLGERVYRAVEAWSRQQGAVAMWIAVFEQNRSGRLFWERMGFSAQNSRSVRVGELDTVAVRMVRRFGVTATSAAK